MSFEENQSGIEKKPISEKDQEKLSEDLEKIKEGLNEELKELREKFVEDNEELAEEYEDLKEDLEDELQDIDEERSELLDEIETLKHKLGNLGEDAKEKVDKFKDQVKKHQHKSQKHLEKIIKKAAKKWEKAQEKAKRINISVPPDMSKDWKKWAQNMGSSVSELIRKSMQFVGENVGDFSKLDELGKTIDKFGKEMDNEFNKSGIKEVFSDKKKAKAPAMSEQKMEKIKRRIEGLIKLHNSIPLEKLALALESTEEYAENLIYELAAEGIQGELDEGVFKFANNADEVINAIFELLENK